MKINKAVNGLLTPLIVYFLKEFMSSYFFYFFFCRQLQFFYKTCSKKLVLSERYLDWGPVIKLALPKKLTRRAYKARIWNL
jgi:hypothetical protein